MLDGADFDGWVEQAGGADDLFGEHAAGLLHLPRGGGGGDKDGLRAHGVPFLEFQRPVVHAGWQAEAVFGQRHFASEVALIHAADLRHGDVALVGENDGVVGDEFEQGGRRLARRAAREVARVVLDAVADACGFQHFEVKVAALLKPLGLQQFALVHQLVEPHFQLFFDADDGLFHRRFGRHVVRVGVDADLVECAGFVAGERVELGDALQLFAEERQRPSAVIKVGGPDLQVIAAHAKAAALEPCVVAFVLLGPPGRR